MKNKYSIFKRPLCKHEEQYCVTNIYGDMINSLDCRSVWECQKCGKRFRKDILDPNCTIVNFHIDKTKLRGDKDA